MGATAGWHCLVALQGTGCRIVRKVLPRTGSCQSGDRHRSSGH
ncbi:unnamed protein product [Staurois parvus]|uniref:Uncharacterized protein n=1 Tax=Staurois parvus TaxID=386267 RepID=A0ABN9GN63_9NEOB|nr:unnamed protein product [Staurois parvus]